MPPLIYLAYSSLPGGLVFLDIGLGNDLFDVVIRNRKVGGERVFSSLAMVSFFLFDLLVAAAVFSSLFL
jgi:hypothetical protein